MTIEGFLFFGISCLLLMNWPVSLILWDAARERPRIRALSVMAISSTLISIGLTVYVLAVINAGGGYIIPREVAQFLFRIVLISLACFPLWFLWLYRTGRFADDHGEHEHTRLDHGGHDHTGLDISEHDHVHE